MERNRDARRGPILAANGSGSVGLSRRRHRNSSRDSPDGDEGMEMLETSRLRDRGVGGGEKKYRVQDGSGRSKRRRGERILQGSSNRDDVDDDSEDSLEDGNEDDDDDLTIRKALPSYPPAPNSSSSPLLQQQQQQQQQNHHNHYHHHQQHSQLQHQRKTFPPKASRPTVAWKADEMIGVAVPRKARSASVKRSHDCSDSGCCGIGVGGEEQIPRQASSPSRLSLASATQISLSSSNASIRKKMKQTSGNVHWPPKVSKAASSSVTQDDIEMEVAEVLFGLTRQQYSPPKQETNKTDERELNGTSVNEARSSVSSPCSILPTPASVPSAFRPSNSPIFTTIAPKRKKPRPVNFDHESTTSSVAGCAVPNPPVPFALKVEAEDLVMTGAPSPSSEQNNPSRVVENDNSTAAGVAIPRVVVAQSDAHQEAARVEINQNPTEALSTPEPIDCMEEVASASKSTLCTNLEVSPGESTSSKKHVTDSLPQQKFNIDLMAPPPGKLSPDGEGRCIFYSDQKPTVPETEMSSIEEEDQEILQADQSASKVGDPPDKSILKGMEPRKKIAKEQASILHLDLEKAHKDDSSSKIQIQKQQLKDPKVEPSKDKSAPTLALNMPMTVRAWPGGFPPFGYVGQVPSLQGVIPIEGTAVPSNALQSPAFITHQSQRKRCATHFYIAQTIQNYQRLAKMNPFWSAANADSIHGAKLYNINILPPSDATLLANALQGSFPTQNMGSLHESKSSAAGASTYSGYPSLDKMPSTNSPMIEVDQRKQVVLQQMPHTGSTTNMLHGPSFIIPTINQQQGAAEKAPAPKSTSGLGNVVAPAGASNSAAWSSVSSGPATPVNLSFTGLPTGDARYLDMFQNNPYPLSLPPHVSGASPSQGATPAQAMPYFFPPHILHPSQIHPPSLQQQADSYHTPHSQPDHQKPNVTNGSLSSQMHPQTSHVKSVLGGASTNPYGYSAYGQGQQLQPQYARTHEVYKGSEENPSTSDGRSSSSVQKGMYGQAFSIPVDHQKFSLMSSEAVAAIVGNAGGHSDKQALSQQLPQKHNVKIDLKSPPAFTMPFTSFIGAGGVLPGLDLSSMSQNHTIFLTHRETARHGYHQTAMVSQVAQNKKQKIDDGKSVVRDSMKGVVATEDEQKSVSGSKNSGSGMQHTLTLSKHGGEISSILNSSATDSASWTLSLIQTPADGSRSMNCTLGGGAITNSSMARGSSNSPASQQQKVIQLQQQTNSSSVHSDHLVRSSTVSKSPQSLTCYPQAVLQDGNLQYLQIKTSSGRASMSITTSSSTSPIVRSNHVIQQQIRSSMPVTTSSASPIVKSNHLTQQQVRPGQQPSSAQSHQTQISFAINPLKVMPASGQHFSVASGNSSAGPGAVAAGLPSNSISKGAGSPNSAPATVGHLSQSSSKTSTSCSASKTSPVDNKSSILGHPRNASAGKSNTKLQQLQAQKHQTFPQAQFYFTNAYMQQPFPVQSSAATAGTASGYYQKRKADQSTQQIQQPQNASVPGSSGMFAVCSSGLALSGTSTSDPAKVIAAAAASNVSNTKAKTPNNLHPSQAVAQSMSGSPHALVPATFPYMSIPAMSVKVAADQKSAAGGGGIHSPWQFEKRCD